MFQSENLQPFNPSFVNYMPRYHPPHPAHKINFRQPPSQCGTYGHKFSSRNALQNLTEHEKRQSEKFNAWNHPLMAIDCKKTKDGSRSSSPADSGVSSQASTPGNYSFEGQCPRNSPHRNRVTSSSETEPRGTKRHAHRTSRSPSPLLNTKPAETCKPKRRYHDEGLPPIVPSASLLTIQLKSHRPDALLNGSEWDRLSHAIWCKYTSHEQTQDTLKKKLSLREMVHHYIRQSYYLHQCGLYIVGSSISGFGGESSDMDLCLVISGHEVDQRFHALEYLYRVQKALKQCRSLTKLDVIRAKVPILRFFDSNTRLEVDLNFNNIVGIRNTHLLKTYAQLDWRVRPLVLVVKLWARHHDINDAKSSTMSSYSLTLMVIHYLQNLPVPVLPCLQKIRAERFWPEGDIRRLQTFGDDELRPLKSTNDMTLGQLFAGFLDYYANQFNAHAISVRVGGTVPIDQCRQYLSPKNDPNHWNYICIEEPFDRTNTAHSVYNPLAFQKIVAVFRESAAKVYHSKDLSSVLP